jgi:hypothetical protein
MKPTLETMRMLVAEMLPDEIGARREINGTGVRALFGPLKTVFFWRDTNQEITPREWLHVCWLAEKTLTCGQWGAYPNALAACLPHDRPREFVSSKDWITLPMETRIEALCRVRHPQLFT